MIQELPIRTLYVRHEKQYDTLYDAACVSPVTFNKAWLNPTYTPPVGETAFHEVRTASLKEKGARSFLLKQQTETTLSFEKHLSQMVDSLIAYMQHWIEEDKIYLSRHSSGYDSRILSGVIRLLGLTNIHFRCNPPETERFKEHMNLLGYKEGIHFSVTEAIKLDEIDFNKIQSRGWHSFGQMGLKFREPKDPNILGVVFMRGNYSGQLWKRQMVPSRRKRTLHYCKNELLNDLLNTIPRELKSLNNIVLPFMNYGYLMHATQCRRKWVSVVNKSTGLDRIREGLLKEIGRRLKLNLLKVPYRGHDRYYPFGKEEKDKLLQWWKHSALRRRHKKELAGVDILDRNKRFNAALLGFSFCYEKLFKEGKC